MNRDIKKYLAEIGRKGGLKSRRKLSRSESKRMLQVREAKRAYREFYAQCFWSFSPSYKIEFKDVSWVAEQLKRHGNSRAFQLGAKLCP